MPAPIREIQPSPEPQPPTPGPVNDERRRVGPAVSPLERALHTLLRVRDTEATADVALHAVQEVFGAGWVALYLEDEAQRLRPVASTGPQPPAEGVPLDMLGALVGPGGMPVWCPEDAPLRALTLPDVRVVAQVELAPARRAVFLLGPRAGDEAYRPDDMVVLHRVVDYCATALQNAELVERLRSQVFVDALTGCYNRRGFDEHLRVEASRAQRYRRPLSLVLLDLDRFKWINDGLGHQVGDHALRRVGAALLAAFRTTDRVCRYGGDEFGVIFPETRRDEVLRLAERMRVHLAGLFPDAVLPRAITASFGVACFPDDAEEPEALLAAADQALYRAKARGRNRVISAP